MSCTHGTKYKVCRWNSIQDIAHFLDFGQFFFFYIWPWPVTLTLGQGHRHLGHWMCLIGLYLGTKYEVCRWNSIRDMAHFVDFGQFLDIWPWPVTLTFGTWVVSWYQVLSLWDKTVLRYEPMFSWLPVWPWNLTFDLESRSSKNISLNVNPVVLPSYQVWSRSVKWFRNYLKLKFSRLKFCPPDAGRRTPDAGRRTPDDFS